MKLAADRLDAYLSNPVRLIEDCLVLESGQPYSDVIQPWQRQFFKAVFAINPDKTPRHRLLYSERRRGEAKTTDMAATALADLLVGPLRHRSYAIAADLDQAALLLDSVEGFKARSEILADVVVQKNVVENTATGSRLKVLSSDAPTSFGVRPRKVWFDELSLQAGPDLWVSMWTSVGKSPHSQMVVASMAGSDTTSVGWQVREVARATPAYFFSTREGSKLAPWLSQKDMAEQQRTLHPADYARYWECKWVEPKGAWITAEMYGAAETGREAQRGDRLLRYVGFVDVGLVRDPTVIAVCHREDDAVVLDTLRTLQGSRSQPVELSELEGLVVDLTDRFKVRHWRFESPQAVASVQRLRARLPNAKVEARWPTVETQAQLFGNLYHLFADRRLVLYPHEQLRREALGLVVKTVAGRLKVVDSGSLHQDHVIGVGGAADMLTETAMTRPEDAMKFIEFNKSLRVAGSGFGFLGPSERRPW